MKANREVINLSFLVLGESKSGKSSLINRVANDEYTEGYVQFKNEPYPYKNLNTKSEEIRCKLQEYSGEIENANLEKALKKYHSAVLLTVDLTDSNALIEAEKWINKIRALGYKNIPIILVGTKSDDKIYQRISNEEINKFVNEYNNIKTVEPLSGLIIFSAKEENNNFLISASDILINKVPELKSGRDERRKNIKTNILNDLNIYTSKLNKFLAYFKAIVSFGFFRLGVKKQEKAEELKSELNKPDADATQLVERYKKENKDLVSKEIQSSWLFIKPYAKQQPTGKVENNEGELGNILNKHSSFNKK